MLEAGPDTWGGSHAGLGAVASGHAVRGQARGAVVEGGMQLPGALGPASRGVADVDYCVDGAVAAELRVKGAVAAHCRQQGTRGRQACKHNSVEPPTSQLAPRPVQRRVGAEMMFAVKQLHAQTSDGRSLGQHSPSGAVSLIPCTIMGLPRPYCTYEKLPAGTCVAAGGVGWGWGLPEPVGGVVERTWAQPDWMRQVAGHVGQGHLAPSGN